MDTRAALDHVFLIAADDHISREDGTYAHPWEGEDACVTCAALVEVQRLSAALGESPALELPESIELKPLSFPLGLDGKTTLTACWDTDELQLTVARSDDDLNLHISGALELDALIELRDKMINPAIAHEKTRQRVEAIERERERTEREAEEAERERAQTFRGVSVRRTITENVTIHGRTCASLSAVRTRQTLGTVVIPYTPESLIARLPVAMTGKLNLRFCAKCKPIPNAQTHNYYLDGGTPLEWTEAMLQERITADIWEAHHAAYMKYDEERSED